MRRPVMMITIVVVCMAIAGCNGAIRNPIRLPSTPPVKFAVESFDCLTDPGAWAADAADNIIAGNRRQASAVIRDCRRQLREQCRALEVNGQIAGRCEDLPPA